MGNSSAVAACDIQLRKSVPDLSAMGLPRPVVRVFRDCPEVRGASDHNARLHCCWRQKAKGPTRYAGQPLFLYYSGLSRTSWVEWGLSRVIVMSCAIVTAVSTGSEWRVDVLAFSREG